MSHKIHDPEHEKHIKLMSVWFVIILTLTVTYFMRGGITGFVVYETTDHTKQWDFSNSAEYTYDDSLLNLTNGVKLIPDIVTTLVEDYSY